jgi:ribonuclease J
MKVRIHRGSKEIGGSCIEVESGAARILLDVGQPLDNSELPPEPPPIDRATLAGIVISHPHRDHYGLLPHFPDTPVAMGAAAKRILAAAAPFMRPLAPSLSGPLLMDRQPIQIGPFRITPYLVDHSAYDAYALLVEADGKRLFYSGDFRLHGRKKAAMAKLMADPPSQIDALLLEGTTLSRSGNSAESPTEEALEAELTTAFRQTTGLALVQCSPQNIDRMVTIFRACLKSHRTLVIDLYAAQVLAATGNPHIPQSHWKGIALALPFQQRIQIKKAGLFEVLKRHSSNRIYPTPDIAAHPERYALLFRKTWMGDLERAGCLADASCIHSQWEGYLRQESSAELKTWLQRHGIQQEQMHVSGHATPDDLCDFARALAPGKIIPVHTDVPEKFVELFPNAVMHDDGEWWKI